MDNLFPNSCGVEVAEFWCPVTSISFLTYVAAFVVMFGISYAIWYRKKVKKEKKEYGG
jgi:uncharacterized ion transporter superfamily protein YfcC